MCDRPTEEFAISIVANFVAPNQVAVSRGAGSRVCLCLRDIFINKSQAAMGSMRDEDAYNWTGRYRGGRESF